MDLSGPVHESGSDAGSRAFAPSACYRYGVRIQHGQTPDDEPSAAWRCVRDERWKYVEVERGARLLFDLQNDPAESRNLAGDPAHGERCRQMEAWLHRDFSWEGVHASLATDRARLPEFLSGLPPGTANQYMLPDGQVFDAEKSLYDARWLALPRRCSGGIIPQQFG